jgi:hypothetical protein
LCVCIEDKYGRQSNKSRKLDDSILQYSVTRWMVFNTMPPNWDIFAYVHALTLFLGTGEKLVLGFRHVVPGGRIERVMVE